MSAVTKTDLISAKSRFSNTRVDKVEVCEGKTGDENLQFPFIILLLQKERRQFQDLIRNKDRKAASKCSFIHHCSILYVDADFLFQQD